MPRVIDLFCGVGGLTYGFRHHGGFEVVAGVDADASCQHAYEHNNPGAEFLLRDVSNAGLGEELNRIFGDANIRVLIGCAPCQTFSTYSQPAQKQASDRAQTIQEATTEEPSEAVANEPADPRWTLLTRFGELACETRPHIISMENVPKLRNHPVFLEFVKTLEKLGMNVWSSVVRCSEFGVPQKRRRLVLLASRLGPINELLPPHPRTTVTVRDRIGNMNPLAAGAVDPEDRYHRASALSEINMRRIIASRPGGTWRDWDEQLRANCHRGESGQTFASVYGRMSYDAIGPTITTQFNGFGNGRFGHPEQNRAISLREGALLQTFPPDYEFVPPDTDINFTVVARHIGNAVPVSLAEAIASHIHAHILANTEQAD